MHLEESSAVIEATACQTADQATNHILNLPPALTNKQRSAIQKDIMLILNIATIPTFESYNALQGRSVLSLVLWVYIKLWTESFYTKCKDLDAKRLSHC